MCKAGYFLCERQFLCKASPGLASLFISPVAFTHIPHVAISPSNHTFRTLNSFGMRTESPCNAWTHGALRGPIHPDECTGGAGHPIIGG